MNFGKPQVGTHTGDKLIAEAMEDPMINIEKLIKDTEKEADKMNENFDVETHQKKMNKLSSVTDGQNKRADRLLFDLNSMALKIRKLADDEETD